MEIPHCRIKELIAKASAKTVRAVHDFHAPPE
jgi:hypothetical protein